MPAGKDRMLAYPRARTVEYHVMKIFPIHIVSQNSNTGFCSYCSKETQNIWMLDAPKQWLRVGKGYLQNHSLTWMILSL
jgi:hypothetical protein